MASPTYVSSGAFDDATGTTIDPGVPGSLADGDLLVAEIYAKLDVPTCTASGWTPLASADTNHAGNQRGFIFVLYKWSDGTETGTVQFTLGATPGVALARIHAIRGVDGEPGYPVIDWAGQQQGNTSSTVTHAPVITNGDGRLAVCFIAVQDDTSSGGTLSGESGGTWVERTEDSTAVGSDGRLWSYTAEMASAGTLSGGSFTMGASYRWLSLAFAFVGTGEAAPATRPFAYLVGRAGEAIASGNVTARAPFGIKEGDLLVAYFLIKTGSVDGAVTLTDWASLFSVDTGTGGSGNHDVIALYKWADGTENGASLTFSSSGTSINLVMAHVAAFRNVGGDPDVPNMESGGTTTNTGTTLSHTAVTATADDRLAMMVWSVGDDTSSGSTFSGAWVKAQEAEVSTAAGSDGRIGFYTAPLDDSESISGETATMVGSLRWLTHTFAFYPDAAATDAPAELASGTGSAGNATVAIAPTAGLATGSGAAMDATVATAETSAPAGVASGTGAAADATVAIAPSAELASGTGVAHGPTAEITVSGELASGSGQAYDAAVSTGGGETNAPAGLASGSGTAYNPTVAIAVYPGVASGSGAAYGLLQGIETGTGTDDATIDLARQTFDAGSGTDAAWTDAPGPAEAAVGVDTASVVKLGESLCGPYSGPVQILYDGVDITSCVIYAPTKFKSSAGGIPGTSKVRIRDRGQDLAFVTGRSLECKIEGAAHWTGYVTKVRRGYFFDGTPDSPGEFHRYYELDGVDLNVLFQKRVLYDKVTPTNIEMTTFAPGTPDNEIIEHYVQQHLDLSGDNISLAGVEFVGSPSNDDDIIGVGGETWASFQRAIRFNTGAIDYIDPDRVFQHVDVDTATAPFGITDRPSAVSGSLTDDFARVEASGWGSGSLGPWADYSLAVLSVDGSRALADDANFVYQLVELDAGAADTWTLTQRVLVPTTANSVLVGFDFLDDPNVYDTAMGVQLSATDLYIFSTDGANYIDDTVAISWSFDEWMYVKLEWDRSTGEIRAKAWQEGDPEPGWLISLAANPDFIYREAIQQGAVFAQTDDDLDLAWDWVTFDYASVTPWVGPRDLEIDFDGSQLRNDVMVWGAGQGAAEVKFTRVEDAASIAEHGTWQIGQFLPTVYKQETVDRIADSYVYGSPQNRRGGKDDAVAVRFKTFERGLRVAQKIPVRSEVYGFARVLPIRSIEISFPTPDDPEFFVVAAEEIDDPWSTAEFFFPDFDVDLDFGDWGGLVFDGFWWDPPQFDQCANARQWRLPIEILVRGSISFGDPALVGFLGFALKGESLAHSIEFNFQNFESDRVDLHYWCRASSGSGEGWDIPAQFVDNEPRLQDYVSSGQEFYVKLRLGEDACYVKAWMIGAAEPSGWGYWVERNLHPTFSPMNLDRIELFVESFGVGDKWRLDFIEAVEGYGPGVTGIDNFNRTVTDGIGIAFNGELWSIVDPPGPGPDAALQWSVNGSKVEWESDGDNGYINSSAVLPVPSNSFGTLADDFERDTSADDWGTGSSLPNPWVLDEVGDPFLGFSLGDFFVDSVTGAGICEYNQTTNPPFLNYGSMITTAAGNWSGEVEFLMRFKFAEVSAFDSQLSAMTFLAYADDFDTSFIIGGFQVQASLDAGVMKLEFNNMNFDTANDSANYSGNNDYVLSSIANQWLWARWRITEDDLYIRFWKDGSSEPGTWTRQASVDGSVGASYLGNSEGTDFITRLLYHLEPDSDGASIHIADFTVTDGWSDICFVAPPGPMPPLGPVTGSLPSMPTPPGWNPAYAYFATNGFIVRGSSRVWLGFQSGSMGGGVFLRLGVDYYEGPNFIAIDDSVDVTGKTVYCSYRAG